MGWCSCLHHFRDSGHRLMSLIFLLKIRIFSIFIEIIFQTIGVFLSNNNTNGEILHKLVLDAIKKLHDAGYMVRGVTSDGATWNRAFWKHFGLKKNDIACAHPQDDNSLLYMISDFPHLIKNLRNPLVLRDSFWVIYKYNLSNFNII